MESSDLWSSESSESRFGKQSITHTMGPKYQTIQFAGPTAVSHTHAVFLEGNSANKELLKLILLVLSLLFFQESSW